MPYKHNEPRRHKIPKARYKVSNWREYDQALQQRGSLTVWVTPEALEAWAPEKTGRRGRPTSYSDIVIETAVMLRLAMGKPWRQTEGMLRSIIRMLGLDLPVPDHTTLSRRSARLSLTTALKKPKGPVHVVIASSGLKIFGAGEWLPEKHGGKPRRSWRRLHLAVDPDSGDILASELTTTDEGDASRVGPRLDPIDGPVSAVFADGAYDGEPTYRTIHPRPSSRRRGRHPAEIKRGLERHGRDRAHSARPAHRAARQEGPDGLAESRRLRQAVLG
jgi:DDE family transposase